MFFFQTVRSYLKTPAGAVFLRSLPSNTWAPPSKDKCMIHVDIDCPPNCRYVTHNRGALKQTFVNIKKNLSFFDHLKPWRRPDTEKYRSKIFMSYSDARECIFEPVIGSRVPKKEMELAKHLYPGVNQVFSDERADFDLWVGKLGNNFAVRDPLLFKTGIYKQAKVLFLAGNYQTMLELLDKYFNVASVKQYFSRDKSIPLDPDRPAENFNDPMNKELMEKVYHLVMSVQAERKAMNSLISGLNKEDKSKSTDIMCPFGVDCPLNKSPPHPDSSSKASLIQKPQCPYAHHAFQLRFARENETRKTAKAKSIARLNVMMGTNVDKKPWIPDGRVQECQNCKVTFVTNTQHPKQEKGNSCSCNKCALEQRLRDKEKAYRTIARNMREAKAKKLSLEKAKETAPVLDSQGKPGVSVSFSVSKPGTVSISPKKSKKPVKLQDKHADYSKKMGLYRRASVYYKSGRLTDAWNAIQEAVLLVRSDRAIETQRLEAKKLKWQRKLNLDPLTLENDAQAGAAISPRRDMEQHQKLCVYKEKVEKMMKPNPNHFLNHQIDLTCLAIHGEIQHQKQNIQRLHEAAEQIEDHRDEAVDDPSKLPPLLRPKKKQMCEYILRKEKCPQGRNCPFAHHPIQLDLVSSDKVVQHLRQTVEALEQSLKTGGRTDETRPGTAGATEKKPLPEEMRDLTKDIDLSRNPFQ